MNNIELDSATKGWLTGLYWRCKDRLDDVIKLFNNNQDKKEILNELKNDMANVCRVNIQVLACGYKNIILDKKYVKLFEDYEIATKGKKIIY